MTGKTQFYYEPFSILYQETDGECNLPENDARFKVTKDTKQVKYLLCKK